MYIRIVLGETQIFSFTNNSLAMRSSPYSGSSCAILRINACSCVGIGAALPYTCPAKTDASLVNASE
jgi:hypothetical protein